jgi:hypothetical protein
MAEIASAPSAPTSTPAPAPSAGAATSVPSTPPQSTTADVSDKLFAHEPGSTEPESSSPWHEQYKEGIHGVPVEELLQAISEGRLPEALHDKLYLGLKDGDQQWEGNVSTLRNGAMMREKFSQQMNALKAERDSFNNERTRFVDDLRGLKESPEQFLYTMQSMGMPVLEAAKTLATQYATKDFMNRNAGVAEGQRGPGDDWFEAVQAKQELQSLKRQHEWQQEQHKQAQEQKQFQQRSSAVQSAALEAFKTVGIDPVKHPQYWDRAAYHLQRIYDSKPDPRDGGEKPLTRTDVRQAVGIVKEEIDNFLRSHGQTQAPQAQKPGSAPLDTRAGKTTPDRAPKQAQQKMTTDDFMRAMRERQGVRVR